MILNERKTRILQAIIKDYIETAEPIGSRTIAKKYNMGISSATIRNEMSDLEDMGLIIQPHASAGRIPSDKGYRLYVDKMMTRHELTHNELGFLQKIIENNISQIDYLMQETARAISFLTNYTTVVLEPQVKKTIIKHLQLVPVDEQTVALVTVMDGRQVRNTLIYLNKAPDYNQLTAISQVLNALLANATIDTISSDLVSAVNNMLPDYEELTQKIINILIDALVTEDTAHVYLSGTKNILAFPEFSDLEKAKVIFQTLEERDVLITMLNQPLVGNMQILIGGENDIAELKNCSIIKANYSMGDDNMGAIGIIGPTRMDYSQAVSVLGSIVENIEKVIKALLSG